MIVTPKSFDVRLFFCALLWELLHRAYDKPGLRLSFRDFFLTTILFIKTLASVF